MCVAVPGKITELNDDTATVDVGGGATVKVVMTLCPDASAGEWVLVHAGFALDKMDEEQALETQAMLAEADMLKAQMDEEIA
ncbi:MAG TPA: HypC/HybG/HupF family hydrogenase formation chaperone [Armatimonadota bacterium]|nr:HypC/HybG/HupF family hydrogenase formation chaperone [Armatimonadota bacterium]